MELMFADELLFRGGLFISAAAGIIALAGFAVLGIRGIKLRKRFDEEYGKLKNN